MPITEESRKTERQSTTLRPLDDGSKDHRVWWISGVAAGVFVILAIFMLIRADSPTVNTAEDIGKVYDHAIILQAREGDSLESAALAVFPNTLIEQRVREDGLSDEAKSLELARYQAEWVRLSRLLTGTTGTSLADGEFFAVPAKADEPGAIQSSRVSTEIRQRTEEAQQSAGG
jgi:hypothetical protein